MSSLPAITEESLVQRVYENVRRGDGRFPRIFVIDDILEAVLLAAIGALVSWLVKRCLNNYFHVVNAHARMLRLTRWSCKVASRTPEAIHLHMDADGIFRAHGERIAAATFATRTQLEDEGRIPELLALAPPRSNIMESEFPEDA